MKPPQTAGPTLWPDRLIVKHRANTAGRDFVCGDIHGCFDTVEHALEQLDYDPLRDRPFSVGDLIDRGPRSADALGWITQGRIATVRGNHEQMMVAALTLEGGESFKSGASRRWQDNGGAWWWGFAGLDESGWPIWRETENQARLGEWLDALRQVPYLRTTETAAGTVGIVHTTDLHHADWEAMCQCVQELAARIERRGGILGAGGTDTPTSILWGRPNVEREQRDADDLPAAITGIELIITGWIDGRTGHKVPDPKTTPNTAATLAGSYVYATSQIPGLDGLRAGNTLVIDTEVDLSAFRLARGWDADERGYDYLYSYPELRAAFDHPHVTREKMVEGINPPERGRRLALYDALAWWLHHVETEWLLLMPGEALIGTATERIDPMLLDLYHEHPVTLRRQCNQWLRGEAAQIPESAAKEAQRCPQAALSAYAGALR